MTVPSPLTAVVNKGKAFLRYATQHSRLYTHMWTFRRQKHEPLTDTHRVQKILSS